MRSGVLLLGVSLLLSGCAGLFTRQVDGVRFREALQLQLQGERDRALAIYRSLDPVAHRYPGALNNMGVIHARQGRLDVAEQLLSQAAEIETEEVVIWSNLGIVRLLGGDPRGARAALERVAPAGERMLLRAVGPGRVDWGYREVQARVQRAVERAERYLARKLEPPRRADRLALGLELDRLEL
jgi:Flp pilus assembly protein TadD